MRYKVTTPAYNERRYGKPWQAIIIDNLTKGFTFLDWQGRPGSAGFYSFDAEPGTLCAYGQKDLRKGRGGVDGYTILLPDGKEEAVTDILAGNVLDLNPPARLACLYDLRTRKAFEALATDADASGRLAYWCKLAGCDNPQMEHLAKAFGLAVVEPDYIAPDYSALFD